MNASSVLEYGQIFLAGLKAVNTVYVVTVYWSFWWGLNKSDAVVSSWVWF